MSTKTDYEGSMWANCFAHPCARVPFAVRISDEGQRPMAGDTVSVSNRSTRDRFGRRRTRTCPVWVAVVVEDAYWQDDAKGWVARIRAL